MIKDADKDSLKLRRAMTLKSGGGIGVASGGGGGVGGREGGGGVGGRHN